MQKLTMGSILRSQRGEMHFVIVAALLAALCWICLESLGLWSLLPIIGKRPESVLYAIVLGAFLGASGWRFLAPLGACFCLLLWIVVCFTPVSIWMVNSLKVAVPTSAFKKNRADAVVVLASGVQSDNEFNSTALARFLGGLRAVRAGWAPRLVLTEVAPPGGSNEMAARNLMRDIRLDCELLMVGPVRNTHDEALAAAALARERNWKTVILVTSPIHARRSEMVFQRAGRDFGWEILSFPCQETTYNSENPSAPRERVQAFSDIIHEWVGIRVYRWRGWID